MSCLGHGLVGRNYPDPQRQEGDADDLEAGEAQRDADDRGAQQDSGHEVADRKLPAEKYDPDDIADHGAGAHSAFARGDGPAEWPQDIVRDPECGDPERDGDDQDEADDPRQRVEDSHPDAAEHEPDHVQDGSHRVAASGLSRYCPAGPGYQGRLAATLPRLSHED